MRQAFKALSFKRIQFLRCFCFSSIIVAQKTQEFNLITALDNGLPPWGLEIKEFAETVVGTHGAQERWTR